MTLVNIYNIENLKELRCKYHLFKVRGLSPTLDDYDKNVQFLSDRLSRLTKSPCMIWKENGEMFIAQPSGCDEPPTSLPLVGTEARIEATGIERELDYGMLTNDTTPLALRFLQFYLEKPLLNSPFLWRPRAGAAFYQKVPDEEFSRLSNHVNMYKGFKMRLILLPDNKIGVCVDVSRMYAGKQTLPAKISIDDFRKYKGKKCIYEYGNKWYTIHIASLSDFNVSEVKMPDDTTLFQHIHDVCKGNKPSSVLAMPSDCSVLTYQTTTNNAVRHVPSALCRMTYGTKHPDVRKNHSTTIKRPYQKKHEIEYFVRTFLRNLNFLGVPIRLSERMLEVTTDSFLPPPLKFGGEKVLNFSVNGNVNRAIEQFALQKNAVLYSDRGYYTRKPLDQQYIVMPKSLMSTFGEAYVEDIKAQVKKAYSPDGEFEYRPSVIVYDDSGRKSIYALGNEIIDRVSENTLGFFPGYGLVVIQRLGSDNGNKEDILANLLTRELRKKSIHVSVSHTEVPSRSYERVVSKDSSTTWRVTRDPKWSGRFRGYLANLVLNKVLLLNSCWPFVLARPLQADLIVGIDVKNTTAAFMVIFKDGRTFSFHTSKSEEKEQLSKNHLSKKLYTMLSNDLSGNKTPIKNIVIHRDGRIFPGEMKGIKEAVARLAEEGMVAKDFVCNFIEIRKTSSIPVRLFETEYDVRAQRDLTNNPQYGTYKIFGDNAFLCTTGLPFTKNGTTRPLHIIRTEGTMPLESILEDVFALANLTYTKIDSCSREPLSIKMADIRLREEAGDYAADSLQFGEEEE